MINAVFEMHLSYDNILFISALSKNYENMINVFSKLAQRDVLNSGSVESLFEHNINLIDSCYEAPQTA